jgi:probable DNA repair protein
MDVLNNKNKLLQLLSGQAQVITPNNRLSAQLLRDYYKHCNKNTVVKPLCQAYSLAVSGLFEQLRHQRPKLKHPLLLNENQCLHLWRSIIKNTKHITYSEGLLNAAMSAWDSCEQWNISQDHQAFSYTLQTRMFQQWWQQFAQKLADLHAITQLQLVPYLLNAGFELETPAFIWACFDEYTPQQVTLQSYLSNQGIKHYCYDLDSASPPPQILAAQDPKEELQQLIDWLHGKITQGERRIGVVVPELQQQSHALKRTLLDEFDAAEFNISLGLPLQDFPIVAHALAWLHLDTQQCTYEEASLLLQSPYLAATQSEFLSRAEYLQASTLIYRKKFTLHAFNQSLIETSPQLAELLNKIKPFPIEATPHVWTHLFLERLNGLGFPGEYTLNSEQYQCYSRFVSLIDEFRQLARISPIMSCAEALNAFTELARGTIFQAQKAHASIHVLGLLEASGCEFDSIWVMGLTSQCLPKKPQLSAFIPPKLQRDLNMPHSTAQRELLFAQSTLKRLHSGSTHETVYSYPKLQGDSPNLPCSLIMGLPSLIPKTSTPLKRSTHLIHQVDPYQVNILAQETISGGTALLGNQAKCPFKAFAQHRLHAQSTPPLIEGIDPKEKGKMLHHIMELIWSTLANQQRLLTINKEDLSQLIDHCIYQALSPLERGPAAVDSSLVKEIEFTRLKRLVLAQLEWEQQRPDFSVLALEQAYTLNLAGLEIKVRVDRLDQVAEKKWIIDYKSSLPSHKPWNETRPQEPQLLLYALLDEHINTLLLLQVKTGAILCNGLSEIKQELKGINSIKKDESWATARDKWEQQLTTLAAEIQEGHCPPQALSKTLCTQCSFQNLCRISD